MLIVDMAKENQASSIFPRLLSNSSHRIFYFEKCIDIHEV